MIGIATTTQNASGDIVIEEKAASEMKNVAARVRRAKTLDGGAVIIHNGVTWADATLQVRGELTAANESKLRTIYEGESTVYLSAETGFYEGAISLLQTDNGELFMTFLIKEKLS